MVHRTGHGERLAARSWRLGIGSALLLLVLCATPASAQPAIGFQGGVAVDPEQVYGGVFWQTGDLARGIRLRPGIDGGIGQGYRIAEISTMFIYGFPLDPKVYFISRLPVNVRPTEFVITGIVAVLICLTATVFPALYAAKLRPSEGLRAE